MVLFFRPYLDLFLFKKLFQSTHKLPDNNVDEYVPLNIPTINGNENYLIVSTL